MACLCPITLTPVIRACEANVAGGIAEVYIAERCDVDTITTTALTGVVSSITMVGAATFTTFQQKKNVANMTTTGNVSDAGVVTYTTDLNIKFNKLDAAKRLNFMALAQGDLIIIVRMVNGDYWLIGEELYASFSAGTINSGTNMTDAQQYDITLQEVSTYAPKKVEMATISTILDANAM